MPARPMMLDKISQNIKTALVREIVKVKCSMKSCAKDGDFIVALRYADAKTDLFGVCKEHRKQVEELNPLAFDSKVKEQTFFLY